MFTNTRSTHRRVNSGIAAEALEDRIAPATLVGLTSKDILVTFDSAAPAKILSAAKISGLAADENIVSLDARPANGLIYGLTNLNTLYTLNPYSGVATQVGAGPAVFPLTGKTSAIDFNPSVDRIRAVTDADLNFRLNPNSGALVDGDPGTGGVQPDTALSYDPADANQGKNPTVTAIAYDRNFQGATLATLFGIDSKLNALVRIGGVDGTPSPNGGVLTTIGALGVNPGTRVGFDIAADGTAYAAMQVGPRTFLFTIDLVSGEATPVGKVGNGKVKIDAITTIPRDEIVVGVTTGNLLVSFRADNPGQLLSSVQLTNLAPGVTITGIDFRPLTGELFGLTSTNQVVNIDRDTGQTILRGATLDGALFAAGINNGIDFNPTVDRLRLVNTVEDNLRFNPITFAVVDSDVVTPGTQVDTDLAFIATDANVGQNPNVTGVAYDRNDNSPVTPTTLFGIDSTLNILVRQGAVDGNAADVAGGGSPNGGLLTTLGSLGVNPTDQVGFDISDDGRAGVGTALAVMQLEGETTSKLFSINLNSGLTNQPIGAATLIGTVGTADVLTAMAIAPASIQFTATNTIVKEKSGAFAVIEITRTGGHDIAASVLFNTSDGTATAGTDYTAVVSELVTFDAGETLKRVMVPILTDSGVEFDETIHLQLTTPLGGTRVLGDAINALVTIQGKKLVV
jgi:3D (Asp-Asp-Asp) domain-containing protein